MLPFHVGGKSRERFFSAPVIILVGLAAGVEASGGIELGNAHKYTRTGVDGISIGALTHSAPSMDVRPELIARLPSDPGASGSGNLLVPNKAARLNLFLVEKRFFQRTSYLIGTILLHTKMGD